MRISPRCLCLVSVAAATLLCWPAAAGPRWDVGKLRKASPQLERLYTSSVQAALRGQWPKTVFGTTMVAGGAAAGYGGAVGYFSGQTTLMAAGAGAGGALAIVGGALLASRIFKGFGARRAARFAVLDAVLSNPTMRAQHGAQLSRSSLRWYMARTQQVKDGLLQIQQRLQSDLGRNAAQTDAIDQNLAAAAQLLGR
jgi:hypothetical protein